METKHKKDKSNAMIKFRATAELKKHLKDQAKENGITMTELILLKVKGEAVNNRIYDLTLFSSIDKLMKEMNSVGNNINQATVALHQIKNSNKIEDGDMKGFMELQKEYISICETLKPILLKAIQWH